MSENRLEILTGAAVLAVAAGFLIYTMQTTGMATRGGGYALTASFRSLDGISIGSDVRLAGVKVGTVTGVDLNTQTYRADTTVSIRDGIEIPDDSAIVVSSEGLLGGNFIEIVPGGSPFYFAAGDEIEDTQGSVSLVSLLMKFVSSGQEE